MQRALALLALAASSASAEVYSVSQHLAGIVSRAQARAGGVAGLEPSLFIRHLIAESNTVATEAWESLPADVRAHALLDLEARKTRGAAADPLPGPNYPDAYYAFAPSTLGAAYPSTAAGGARPLSFASPCFATNTLSVTSLTPAAVSFSLAASSPNSSSCNDLYLLGTIDDFTVVSVTAAGTTNLTLDLSQSRGAASSQWLANYGVRIFRFPDANIWTTLYDVVATLSLYFPANVLDIFPDQGSQDRNRQFLADYANVSMPPRAWANTSGVVNGWVDVDPSYFRTGDLLAIHRLDGLSTLEQWGTGAHTSHIAFFYWNASELFVVESTDKTVYWPAPSIQMTPWPQWANLSLAAGYAMVHLPLKDDIQAALDLDGIANFVYTTQGLPYG
jgi:hypothetical protein